MFIKYPSTEALRHLFKRVYKFYDTPYPTIDFLGQVKLHGTNAGVVVSPDDKITYQSRNRNISVEQDNAGFARFMQGKDDFILSIRNSIQNNKEGPVAIYGEFIGKGIQKNVAVSQVEKAWVVFAIQDSGGNWYYPEFESNTLNRVFNIIDFPVFKITIDFNDTESAQEAVQTLVNEVEKECPVGKAMGVSGLGEGLVFTNYSLFPTEPVMFKAKGEKHSVSKVASNKVSPNTYSKVAPFLSTVLTKNRYDQAKAYFNEMGLELELKNTGKFIQWVSNDVKKEESDLLELPWSSVKKILDKEVAKYYKSISF